MALTVSSISAEFSKDIKTFGKQDVYLEFVFGDREHKTEVLKSAGKLGAWDDAVQLKGAGVNAKIIAKAKKALGKDSILGTGEVNVVQTVGQGMQTVQLHHPHTRDNSGTIRFIISGGSPAISGNPHTEGHTLAHMASDLERGDNIGLLHQQRTEGATGLGTNQKPSYGYAGVTNPQSQRAPYAGQHQQGQVHQAATSAVPVDNYRSAQHELELMRPPHPADADRRSEQGRVEQPLGGEVSSRSSMAGESQPNAMYQGALGGQRYTEGPSSTRERISHDLGIGRDKTAGGPLGAAATGSKQAQYY